MSGYTAVGHEHEREQGNGDGRVRVGYDRDENESPSVAAATALAAFRGDDVTATNVRLYDYVDPEALDALFATRHDGGPRANGTVRFEIEGATVVVESDHVRVYEAE